MNRSVLGFLTFVVALILAVGFVWPKAAMVRDLGVEEQAKRKISASKEEKLKALSTLSQTFAANTTRIDSIISILPQSPEIPEALVTIEAVARANGVNIQSLTPQVDDQKQQVVLTLVGDGDLQGVEGFVANMADNNRPVSVSSTTLTKSPDGKRLNVSFGLSFPYKTNKSGSK